jgi:hypothetical protein
VTAAPARDRRLAVFAFLWAAAVLLHQLYQGRLLLLDATAPLSFAALYALLRPASPGRLALLAALQLATLLWELPRVSNHWLLMGVVNLGLLIVLLPALRSGRADDVPVDAVLGPVRAQIVILYLWATFHKLNAGFFDPELSCGVDHYARLAASLPLLPTGDWTRGPAIAVTLLTEAALPLLIALPATRPAALVLGWGFHAVLGWNGYWDFASVAAACYAACLPAWALGGFDRARARSPRLDALVRSLGRAGRSRWAFPAAAGGLAACLLLPRLGGELGPETVLAVNHAGRFVWLALWLLLGAVLALSLGYGWMLRSEPQAPAHSWWRRPALWLAPALLLANGLSPYLGLKSEHSFAMFSNLRTEGDSWNHYLVPPSLRRLDYGAEVVRIRASSDPMLQNLARHGFGLVPLELRRHLAERPGASVRYVRGGRVVRARRAAEDPFLAAPLLPLERKLILFRPIPPRGANACLH